MNFFKIIKALVAHPIRFYYTMYYRRKMIRFGLNSSIDRPLRIWGMSNIDIGSGVQVHSYTWLQAIPLTGDYVSLIIKDGCNIGDFNHIVATRKIEIGNDVLTANNVYISDNLHEYSDINIPIKQQIIKQLCDVYIGDGSWIGENVSIIGASIGKQCVIGANSVVTKDIPDYSVAVGVPAKVIKKYDFDLKQWVKC